jgi:hypothetical protein
MGFCGECVRFEPRVYTLVDGGWCHLSGAPEHKYPSDWCGSYVERPQEVAPSHLWWPPSKKTFPCRGCDGVGKYQATWEWSNHSWIEEHGKVHGVKAFIRGIKSFDFKAMRSAFGCDGTHWLTCPICDGSGQE